MDFEHVSVLLKESIEGLNIAPDGVYVDCTLGGGGHSYEIAKRLTTGTLIGIDRDKDAIEAAGIRLKEFENVKYVHNNFSDIKNIVESLGFGQGSINGFLLDLGVSSHQLDEADRGFSYNYDAPLDMRMDVRSPLSAYVVVNEYSQARLSKLLREYGEERWAERIAEFIVKERKQKPVETTSELVSIIKKAIPKGARSTGPHPAKRSFQAIRIEVNNELGILEEAIDNMVELLKPGGRICVITFHSLEDRIVKNVFRSIANPCTCPRDFPICVCGKKPRVKVITGKPIIPGEAELEQNHRARSAKLRIAERL